MTQETKHTPNAGRLKDESAIEYARRAISWLDVNDENLLDGIKTTEGLFELFDLISVTYDTSTISEMYELIEYHGDQVAPLRAFIKKHKLNWRIPRVKARGEA